MRPTILLNILSSAIVMSLPHATWGQSYQAEYLRGLDSVRVLIEPPDAHGQAAGLSEDGLRTKVELELRRVGIPVTGTVPFFPALYVNVNVLRSEGGFIYCVSLQLRERVALTRGGRSPVLVLAPVWSDGTVGLAGTSRVPNSIIDSVVVLVERFMNDYLAVNPGR